jgi:cell shape-determining protein MreD
MNYQRVRQYDLLLQCLVILALLCLSAAIEQWIRSGIELPLVPTGAILGLLLSVLCWVPTRTVLRYFRRYFEVY